MMRDTKTQGQGILGLTVLLTELEEGVPDSLRCPSPDPCERAAVLRSHFRSKTESENAG